MSKFGEKLVQQWQDAVNFVLGVWLFFSPWIIGFTGETAPAWNAYVLGVIIAVAAAAALVEFAKWEEWANALFGAWLIVSPWILGFSGLAAAMWNAVIVGLIVLVLAVWAAMREHTGGPVATKSH